MPRCGHQQNVWNFEPFNFHIHFRMLVFVSACVCMPQLEEHDQQNSASRQVPRTACLVGHLLVTWMLAPKPAAIYNYSSICALDATDVVWPKGIVWNLHQALT